MDGLPRWLSGKESACWCRRRGFDPWARKIPWSRNGIPLQYSCLENPRDRGACWARSRRVTKSQKRLSNWAFTHAQTNGYLLNAHFVSLALSICNLILSLKCHYDIPCTCERLRLQVSKVKLLIRIIVRIWTHSQQMQTQVFWLLFIMESSLTFHRM